MKRFKQIDCIVQCLVILLSFLGYFIVGARGLADGFIVYFLVGGWQLLSAVIHLFRPQFNRRLLRNLYWVFLAVIVTGGVIMNSNETRMLDYMFAMLFVTPVLAIYYCVVCIIETKGLHARTGA